MMTLKRTYMNIEKKTRFNTPVTDCDCEYYVTGVIPGAENVVILKALEKMIKAISNHEGTNDIISVIEMMINNNEFGFNACYNEMKNGGGAYEIEINDYNDGTMSIYIRVAEIDHAAEEPAAEDHAAEEKPSRKTIKFAEKDSHQNVSLIQVGNIYRVNVYGDSHADLCSSSSGYKSLDEAIDSFKYYCELLGVPAEDPAEEEPAAAPDYSSFKGCTNCEICPKKCIHENTFRRLPYEVGGLGLCENL